MKNKALLVIFIILSTISYQTVIAQKPIICLAERMIKTTSFDTSTFHRGCAPMDNGTCLWDNGKTLYIKFLNGGKALQEKTKNIAKQWEQYANMHIQFVDNGPSNVRIEFTEDGYIYSALGTYANMCAQNEATMIVDSSSFNDSQNMQSTILHLFGHVLGLQHEIYASQRSNSWKNLKLDSFFSKPRIKNHEFKSENYKERYASNFSNSLKYDEQSIMVAPIPKNYTTNKEIVLWNKTISENDRKVIAILYPKERVDYENLKNKPTINFFDLKIVKNDGFSFFPIFDFNNIGSRNYVYFSIVLVNKKGEPIRTTSEDYNINNQVGTFTETMFVQGDFKGINRARLSDVQFFIPQSAFNTIDLNNGVFAVFKAFYFNRDTEKVEWLYISKPFEVKL